MLRKETLNCQWNHRRPFEAFRETVRPTTPDGTDESGASESTERPLAAYREATYEVLLNIEPHTDHWNRSHHLVINCITMTV